MKPIYLDYNATTPVDPRVSKIICDSLTGEEFGNPSSTHHYGKTARQIVDHAREKIAKSINAEPDEIIFTGGGTESSNQAILATMMSDLTGFLKRLFSRKGHLIISAIEHPATYKPAQFLSSLGFEITTVGVDRQGLVDPGEIQKAIRKNTKLISIMHSNNEVGTLQPIEKISEITRSRNILFHTDAAQSTGKVHLDVKKLGVDFLTIAGHKLYAPKGIGALYIRKGVKTGPYLHGAGHESGLRAGTENVHYIAGLGEAANIATENLAKETPRLIALREQLFEGLKNELGDQVVLNGHPTLRLPNTLNVSIIGCKGWEILEKTPEIAASTGSACHEGKVLHSAVLCAMSTPLKQSEGALRLTLGRYTSSEEITKAIDLICKTARKLMA
ncbi:cysteine desulfurase [bacterium]|nr:cysteine desulfurase [bacterium]